LRILYLTQILSPSIGGGELVFFNLAKGMLKIGHQVSIICHKKKRVSTNEGVPPSADVAGLEEQGARIYYVKPELEDRGGILLTYRQQFGYIINALRLGSSLVRDHKIDIIHANVYTPVIVASILGKFHHIPVVITVHNLQIGSWKDWSSQKNIPRFTSLIGPLYEKMILGMPVHAVHLESNKVKSELTQFNPKARAVVIYNGVDTTEEYTNSNSELGYGKFILYIGRLVILKNLQIVILAFKDVIRILPEAKLIVVGDGPMRQAWQDLVDKNNLSNNVLFLGHISDRTTKLQLLSKCSAVVFPSTDEGFPLVPIEAFAMSNPLLMSNVKPADEIVDDNIDGFLLPPDDPAKWSEKMVYMLSNSQASESMGKKGRDKVANTFNMTVVSNKMEKLYEKIIASEA
jgi:glycosyltransferase involved in cell wall biosynthesis